MKKSKNKIIMIVLTATIISNTMVPISTLAESNTILNNTNYATELQTKYAEFNNAIQGLSAL